jgi:hypothetical protein
VLILTSDACRDPRDVLADAVGPWPGPVLFAALPGHGLRRADLRALEAEAIVLDCLEPPPSPGALLCEVAARLPWVFEQDEGPLVLAVAPTRGEVLRERRARGLSRPDTVEPEWSPERRLLGLLLGEAVATHPLAADTLALLGTRRPDDATLVEVVAAALGGQHEGRSVA